MADKLLDRVFGRPIPRDQLARLDGGWRSTTLDDLQPEVVVRLVAAMVGV